jgi:hypothetical protein
VAFSATPPEGCTIDWYTDPTGGTTVTGGYGVTSFSPSLTKTTTYYAQARHIATSCVYATTRLPVTATVHGIPTITLTTANNDQTVTEGDAITDIKYTTTNATGASISGQPADVSGNWSSGVYTISGTPTGEGTFNYTVTTTNSNGCTNATASGTITVDASCTECIDWATCSSVSSATDAYTDKTHSGFTVISTDEYENDTHMDWSTANTVCANRGAGWRLPTRYELECICANRSTVPGGYATSGYWSSTRHGVNYATYNVTMSGCNYSSSVAANGRYVKCVK